MERIVRRRYDDFDNSKAADHRIVFSINGKYYRLDLCDENKDRFETDLQPYIDAAEAIPAPRGTGRGSAANAASDAEIREWARGQGIEVPDRGRVKSDIVDQYYNAHSR